ncbi:hypothetical protein C8Q69DRAFT_24403 [Paecilomyces variotii]|uniref:Uncharacterized protein n=1 Tax=Byssochlamys spectabilis TaxID=264951 RepID=A0A443I5N4_BYSSP|nr:hypothetical protein C8Q69DRAFT_24403 [Paecilomyces variotii]KAJ9286647.1 hypothetical protein DTO021C3_5801 [Paecilomyces variotii]KAJ9307544.1 hypothetical protein DTO217A2_3016 [Paecilomyces variotii]KAJ9357205.1 hypothetical protein DTO280E4_5770 [Paecilomyces variotii]RWQ99408.1 hypothetical protein C8Q69DRAFT_24403 [Paecilomyces variotii]
MPPKTRGGSTRTRGGSTKTNAPKKGRITKRAPNKRTTKPDTVISSRQARELSPEELCFLRGPNGPPTYDHLGYELDYHKVAGSFCRRGRPGTQAYTDMLERDEREKNRKADIMGGPEWNQRSAMTLMLWTDRVARDLGIPYHKVKMEQFEEWHAKGFRANGEEFIAANVSPEEQDRVTDLATGSAFRK